MLMGLRLCGRSPTFWAERVWKAEQPRVTDCGDLEETARGLVLRVPLDEIVFDCVVYPSCISPSHGGLHFNHLCDFAGISQFTK